MNVSCCVPSFLLAAAPLILAQSMHSATLRGTELQKQATGKAPSDVVHKKKTLPVIYAFEHAAPVDRERLLALYALAAPTEADVAEIVSILERTGAHEYTRDQARRYRDEALAELDAAGVVRPAARERLEQIIVSVIAA